MSILPHDELRAGSACRPGDALLVADVQYDFLPGGALGVAGGDEIVPVLNHYIGEFVAAGRPVILTRDWHPPDHCSFEARGGPWPPHCVAGTWGADFTSDLDVPDGAWIISKATEADSEAYSAFQGTDLEQRLRSAGITRIFVGGLATEYCVKSTVDDAIALGFRVCVLEDAIRSIDVNAGDGRRAVEAMRRAGAKPVSLMTPVS